MRIPFLALSALMLQTAGTSAPAPPARIGRPAPACTPRDGLSLDSLRRIAIRLHPELTSDDNRRNFTIVGLVFDSECTLVRHAIGRRDPEPSTVDTTLSRLIPATSGNRYRVSGFAEASSSGPASPWIVWGVVRK
jgi:hypothetical protein